MNFKDRIYYGCAAWASIFPNRAAVLNHLFLAFGNGYDWEAGTLIDFAEPVEHTAPCPKLDADGEECTCGFTSRDAAIAAVFTQRRERHEAEIKWKATHPPTPITAEQEAMIEASIEKAIAASREARLADPEAFEKTHRELSSRIQAQKEKFDEDERWEYAVPDDIEARIEDTRFTDWCAASEKYSYLLNFPDDIQPDWLDGIIETCNLVIAQPGVMVPPHWSAEGVAQSLANNIALAQKALDKAIALKKVRIYG